MALTLFSRSEAGATERVAPDQALLAALILEPIAEHAWRVCDSRASRGEGRFLGFLEAKGDAFELMQVADDFVWTLFPTSAAALDHVARTNSEFARARSACDLAWLA